MAKPLEVNSADFEAEVTNSEIPVAVDFWAAWCGPCRMIAPIMEELAVTYEGKVKIAKMDVDSNQELAAKFRIMSIPNVLFFKGGEVVDQIVGAMPKQQFVDRIEKMIGAAV